MTAPIKRSTLLYATSGLPRLPLLTMNAVSTIYAQRSAKKTWPRGCSSDRLA